MDGELGLFLESDFNLLSFCLESSPPFVVVVDVALLESIPIFRLWQFSLYLSRSEIASSTRSQAADFKVSGSIRPYLVVVDVDPSFCFSLLSVMPRTLKLE